MKKLKPEEIKLLWEAGFYTAPGYLYHLIIALQRGGRLEIDHVETFCQRWKIPRSSFQRAKVKLIKQGVLQQAPTHSNHSLSLTITR